MNHVKAIELRNKLAAVKGLKSHEVNYGISENLERLELAIKPLIKQEKEAEEIIKDFAEERKAIGEKYSTVDGEVKTKKEITNTGVIELFDIPLESMPAYNKDIAALRTKHAEKIKEYEAEKKKYAEFLETSESAFVPYLIKKQHVPDDISTENMAAIFPIIKKKLESE